MANGYDVIVIGSGFGGAVSACRLAEKGMKVLVLERGRRWKVKDYPREPGDAWIWSDDAPHKWNGWMDLSFFFDMAVVRGSGVGGGSLIYAAALVEGDERAFRTGWPEEITYQELKPYYDKVGRMLNAQTLPENQLTERYKLMRDAAKALGYEDRFRPITLGTSFNEDWNYNLDDPFNHDKSKVWINDQGQEQGTCVHCGNCDIGCHVHAKNTLDLNYLPQAEKHGAEIRPLHLVRRIVPEGNRYRVHFDRIDPQRRRLIPGSETAERVILGAGSMGTNELLLRCRDQYRTLPRLSPRLGYNWTSNGDFITFGLYGNRRVSATQGPTITSSVSFLDGAVGGREFFVEDGGFPDVLGNYFEEKLGQTARVRGRLKRLHKAIEYLVRGRDPLNQVMPWFGQAVDAADGRCYLGRRWFWPWQKALKLDWDIDRSEATFEALAEMHVKMIEVTGGTAVVPPTWTLLRNLITPHPLGGCAMGTDPSNGVVNHQGEVFGYERLYVADGAIIPRALGFNPAWTIASLAERIADHIE